MSSVRFCHSWKAETKYICLICQGPACNRPDCAVFLSEEAPNWKSGSCASACLSCNINSDLKLNDDAKQDVAMIAPQASNSQSGEKPRKRALHTSAAKETSKRNCLSFQQRVEMINHVRITQMTATAKLLNILVSVGRRRRKSWRIERRFSLSTKVTCSRVRRGSAQQSTPVLTKHCGNGIPSAENPTSLLTA